MTFIGWAQILIFCVLVIATVRPLGGFMTRVFAGERTFLSPVLGPIERGFYRLAGVDPNTEQHWTTYAVAMLLFNLAGMLLLYAILQAAGPAAAQSAGLRRGRAGPRLQHGGELHHQHQLAELRRREHALLSDPDGRADGPEFRLGRDRHRARHRAGARLRAPLDQLHRQFLGRSHALHALRPAADLDRASRSSWSGRACRRTSRPMSTRRRSKAGSRRSRRVRSRARSPSRCSAPTAAASSTPMRRIPTRTRRRSPTWSRCGRSSRSARPSPTPSAAWSATSARAGRSSPRWASCSSPASSSPIGPRRPATRS